MEKITKEDILIWQAPNYNRIFSEEKEEEIRKLERDFVNYYYDALCRWEECCKAIRAEAAEAVQENGDYVLQTAECNAWETGTADTYGSDDYSEYLRKLFVSIPEGYPDNMLNPNDPVYYQIAYASIESMVCFGEYPDEAEAYYKFQEKERE